MNTSDTKGFMLQAQCDALEKKLDALWPPDGAFSVICYAENLWVEDMGHPYAPDFMFIASKKTIKQIMTSSSLDTDLYMTLTRIGLDTESSLMASLQYG